MLTVTTFVYISLYLFKREGGVAYDDVKGIGMCKMHTEELMVYNI